MTERRTTLVWILLGVLAAALPAAGVYVKNLDMEVDTPVYRLPADVPLPDDQLQYVLRWAGIPVATAAVQMRPAVDGEGLYVAAQGATHPVIDWVYRYRFWGTGRVHTTPFGPDHFIVDECTNEERDRTEIRFPVGADPIRGIRHRKGRLKQYEFHSQNSYDIPSAAYLLMNLDYAPGASYELDTFTGKSRYLLRVEVAGRERTRAAGVEHEAWRLRLFTRELTEDDPDGRHRETNVWVSSERPRRLLRASSQTFVGAISVELAPGYESVAASPPTQPPSEGRCG